MSNKILNSKTDNKLMDTENEINNEIQSMINKNKTDKDFVKNILLKIFKFKYIDTKLLTVDHLLYKLDRLYAIEQLQKYIKNYYISIQVEKGLYEFSLNYTIKHKFDCDYILYTYLDKLHDLCNNLDINNKHINNQTLLPLILNNDIDPYKISFLPPHLIHPMRWNEVIQKQKLHDEVKYNVNTTDLYKCKKCGDRRFIPSELQLRSADEPSSKFYVCLTCGFTFVL